MKSKKFCTVYETTDYKAFKSMKGNRNLNKAHVNRIAKSMEDDGLLLSPILVNGTMRVIDGQHRLEACIKLGLPVRYIIAKGYGLKQVQVLNANMHNWKMADHLQSMVSLGLPEYIKLKEFIDKFPKLNMNTCLNLANGQRLGGWGHKDQFNQGKWVFKNIDKAEDWANKLLMVGQHYKGFQRTSFISAFIHMMNHPDYNHAQFLRKLKFQHNELNDCTSKDQYVLLIEDIYNFRSREKVGLKYIPTMKVAS